VPIKKPKKIDPTMGLDHVLQSAGVSTQRIEDPAYLGGYRLPKDLDESSS
jgi:hypothetical protein